MLNDTAIIPDMQAVVGSHDIVFITLDTLRYDVAQALYEAGELPVLARFLPQGGWERRHSPATFTYAAHQAFFAGFLPTPAAPGRHPRLFASAFAGSETTSKHTYAFAEADIPAALAARGYRTICIGGVGFFNKQTALGTVLPSLFQESHWSAGMGVASRHSTQKQVALAIERLADGEQRTFLFINVAALHTPNRAYLPGCRADSLDSHAAALRYVDGALAPLFAACAARAPTFAIICSDHGSAYGEDGYRGHRVAHDSVWNVPYAHFFIAPAP
ncbi:STM4013/SEN3800 family hydrolase [Janthinobacterium sp. 1_2014MBL_MicDiv]|uniref:STM4013/SEN3800 family hydrolase n=1 Tax=Janthinobacterium sp. 1_2014MBL_MicDiv TaxID=1644131 RepID=UPI0008F54436|nr:STM4013/SEN3800 family hydrolase [Janthinobacterium sp. 1_2014MBL_MicDiv]APA68615.1 metalloenzyme domain-containing protein [Janthinobacterium sp. 1_2014MBL_MicDiv]